MKTVMRYFLFNLLAICLIFSFACADEASYSEAEETINMYSTNNVNYSVSKCIKLKSHSYDSITYTYYELAPYGYAILLDETGTLMEANFENCYMPYNNSYNDYYYGGPLNYHYLNDGAYYNMLNNSFVSESEISLLCEKETGIIKTEVKNLSKETQAKLIERATESYTTVNKYVEYEYFKNLDKYGVNRLGTCTVLATAVLLGYYDTYIDDLYVDSVYRDGNGTTESFHQLLNNYVYGTGTQGGIFIHDAASGINNYLNDRGLTTKLCYVYTVQNSAIGCMYSCINNGKPVIASIATTYGAGWNHTCLVYGAIYRQGAGVNPLDTIVFKCNMCWNDVTYNEYTAYGAWFYECGYIS